MEPVEPILIPHTSQNVMRRRALIRVATLAGALACIWGVVWYFDWYQYITTENLRAFMSDAGWLGIVAYVAAFIVGNLAQVPSNVFLAAAVLSYGFFPGYPLALGSIILSVSVSFFFVRGVGGKALTAVERPWVRKALNRLDRYPVSTVVILRLAFAGSPWLNYLLAMSDIRFRDYLLGSAVGLTPHLAVLAGLLAFAVESTV